jgi:hypothetical protein
MVRMSPSFRQSLAWLLVLAGPFSASAQGGLTTESPFLPAGAPAGAATENAGLEFRGVMGTNQGPVFLIVDPTGPTKKSAWVKLNENGHDFSVKNYDTQSDTVSVDYRGRLLSLSLAKSKVGSSGVPMPPSAGTGPGGQPPSGPISPVVLNPTAADETRRLEAVTQEVLRRRQLRQQAAAAPGGPPVPPSPNPMQPTSPSRPQGAPPPGPGVQVR